VVGKRGAIPEGKQGKSKTQYCAQKHNKKRGKKNIGRPYSHSLSCSYHHVSHLISSAKQQTLNINNLGFFVFSPG